MSFFTQRYSPLNSLSASLCACEVSWPTLQLLILDWIWPGYVSFFFQSSKIKVFIVTILKWLDEKSKITLILVFRAIRNTVPSFIRTPFPKHWLIFPSVFQNLWLLSVKGLMTGQWFLDPPAVLQPSSLGLLKHRNITHYDHSTHDFTSRCTDAYTQKTDLL